MRRLIDGVMGQEIYRQTALEGHDPRDFTMFAFGGAGPVHAAAVAGYADVHTVATFPHGSEFNAYGVATMPVMQTYERTRMVQLFDGDDYTDSADAFNDVVRGLVALGRAGHGRGGLRTRSGEPPAGARHELRGSAPHRAARLAPAAPGGRRRCGGGVRRLQRGVRGGLRGRIDPPPTAGSWCSCSGWWPAPPVTGWRPRPRTVGAASANGESPGHATREVSWPGAGAIDTPVYDRAGLPDGFSAEGPALMEDVDTTVAVPPGWRYALDGQRTGWLTASEAGP